MAIDNAIRVAKYRIDSIAELARQLAFTPQEARGQQLSAAEDLLLDLDPVKAYPLDFVIFRVTGYHPKTVGEDLLTGMALRHDLGLLIEQVSSTLELRTEAVAQPVMDIDQVCARFNVTSKTIQRWRRKGLAARRFVFPDGKRRVGFLLRSVERYLVAHRDQGVPRANFSDVSGGEALAILRHAERLAWQCQCCEEEIARRIGVRLNRSPLAVAHIVRKHDEANPLGAILPRAVASIGEEERLQIMRGYRRRVALKALAKRFDRPRSAIYRIVMEDRLGRLNKRKVKFIDDPLYHQSDAAAVVDEIARQQDVQDVMAGRSAEEARVPRDLPPYLQELYRTPLLSPAKERALFLKLNFHKFQFVMARRKVEEQSVRAKDLNRLETIRRRSTDVKNAIVRANLRLVVSIARKHLRSGLSLMELVSEGNLILMRAVDSFDFHKGNRFSTYATLALMKGFARSVPQILTTRRSTGMDDGVLAAVADHRHAAAADQWLVREHVHQLLRCLEPRERDVLKAHFGLADGGEATYEQVGARLGLTKQRVRQIERSAIAKLRAASIDVG